MKTNTNNTFADSTMVIAIIFMPANRDGCAKQWQARQIYACNHIS